MKPSKTDSPAPTDLLDTRAAEQLRAFFDAEWYLTKYPELRSINIDPLTHYILYGAGEGRDPNGFFDSAWYVARYPEVAASNFPALLHYLTYGAAELRDPHPRFDAAYYVEMHPEAAANPLLHHIRVGAGLGWLTEQRIDIRACLPSQSLPASCPDGVVVDLVVAVYRGLRETQDCLNSVLQDPDRPPGRVLVIEDRSPEPKLVAWLRTLANAGRITLLHNARNLGFVASVNRGMQAAGGNDVVLLNSDTVVPHGWLRRLAAQAYAVPRVASVSPFSNNATICGYPAMSGVSPAFGLDVHTIDAVCRTVNVGRAVEVPTTVGFCMYIRRAALNDVGRFDAKTFGLGYGEENDFCLRAAARGWRHMLACDTYVFHEGNVSFGAAAEQRKQRSLKALLARYPDYLTLIERHVRLDPAGPARFALTAALLRASGKPSVLMVSHRLGGGVKRHIDELVARLDGTANVLLLGASARGVSLSVPALPGHSVLALPADRLDDLVAYLRTTNPRRMHVHHVLGLELDAAALARRLEVGFDLTIHDYFAICPQVNLIPGPNLRYCGEPGPATCNACIAQRPSYGAREILSWRRSWARLLLEAERVLCPSEDVRARLARYGLARNAVLAPHEAVPGAAPGAVPGAVPGVVPRAVPGTRPAAVPAAVPEAVGRAARGVATQAAPDATTGAAARAVRGMAAQAAPAVATGAVTRPASRAVIQSAGGVTGAAWVVRPPPLRAGGALRIAFIGVLAAHKGEVSVITLAEAAPADEFALHLIGHAEHDLPAGVAARMRVTGKYQEADLPRLLAAVKPHVAWFPAQWPETYSYTLSAAIDANLPIVASRIGAFPERLEGRPLTWLVDPAASTEDWLAVFRNVRAALGRGAPPTAPRRPVEDFYARDYAARLLASTPQRAPIAPLCESAPPREPAPLLEPAPLRRPAAPLHAAAPLLAPAPLRRPAAPLRATAAGPRTPVDPPPAPVTLHAPALRRREIDLRRPGRVSVLVVPERLPNGALSPCAYIRLLQPLDHPAIAGGHWAAADRRAAIAGGVAAGTADQFPGGFDVVVAGAHEVTRFRSDIVATQRYAVPDLAAADTLAAHCRDTGARLLYDIDDDLLNIPRDHPEAKALRPHARTVARMLHHADAVWVPTPGLAEALRAARPTARPTIRLVPNGLDERLWGTRAVDAGAWPGVRAWCRIRRGTWRGTGRGTGRGARRAIRPGSGPGAPAVHGQRHARRGLGGRGDGDAACGGVVRDQRHVRHDRCGRRDDTARLGPPHLALAHRHGLLSRLRGLDHAAAAVGYRHCPAIGYAVQPLQVADQDPGLCRARGGSAGVRRAGLSGLAG